MARASSNPLDQSVEVLRFVGPRNISRLRYLGIHTIGDLLRYAPNRYEDYSAHQLIGDVSRDQVVTLIGRVVSCTSRYIFPRKLTITEAVLQDESGAVRLVWFNRPYLEETLAPDSEISVSGKVKLDARGLFLASPQYEKVDAQGHLHQRHTGRLVPIYPETAGVTSKYLRLLVEQALELVSSNEIDDPLPLDLRRRVGLLSITETIRALHYPTVLAEVDDAKKRIAFESIFFLQLKSLIERRRLQQLRSVSLLPDVVAMRSAIKTLPFALTKDQRNTLWEILQDTARVFPMNRLLEGDVGSGKTIVAALAARNAIQQGWQVAILVPTEVLAVQHFETFCRILPEWSTQIALLTGSRVRLGERTLTKPALKKLLAQNKARVVIGTHAIIQKTVRLSKVALVVVDEQHRFGVDQRSALARPVPGAAEVPIPHLLSMSATPIPRTLALTVFGDLDISTLREKPVGRKPIITKVVLPDERLKTYDFIDQQMDQGHQVLVICPRVELETPTARPASSLRVLWAEVKAVTQEYDRLRQEIFPHRRIALLHGRMKPKEKELVMAAMHRGEYDLLVSTSVIEVGVDLPRATIMLIEGADRFGLAQLHQFRGRVGRGQDQAYCFLIPTTPDSAILDRLQMVSKTTDGFALAEHDLRLRGPGQFLGLRQSGLPDIAMAALADTQLIQRARQEARVLLHADPTLTAYPLLREQVLRLGQLYHFE